MNQDHEQWWTEVGQYAVEPPAWTRLYETELNRSTNMGLKIGDFSNSKYLRKEDIGEDGEEVTVTIKGVRKENVARDDEEPQYKAAIYFKELPKPMIANFTNLNRIAAKYGDDTELWVGKPVKVFFDPEVMFGKERKGGLRVRVPTAKGKSSDDDFNRAMEDGRDPADTPF